MASYYPLFPLKYWQQQKTLGFFALHFFWHLSLTYLIVECKVFELAVWAKQEHAEVVKTIFKEKVSDNAATMLKIGTVTNAWRWQWSIEFSTSKTPKPKCFPVHDDDDGDDGGDAMIR